ncbi:predicted protein [Pyrenophora tritici-repentis Pt-1C-BFP]|uniref:Uncharacterized protein n=1 Tax=Pyrenophora tritici-repentis (strain Pt-1C-BFP) TaxID=426418 RepID=B2WHT4_PYRTR|nr:uncharacterized protein PTRG_09543 [Pyrenophora tritici-repentis Pt-1C-BFP]EDU42594.1 predicted protein [Pyrenophora tritici-repentis Pt-1C-BFP]
MLGTPNEIGAAGLPDSRDTKPEHLRHVKPGHVVYARSDMRLYRKAGTSPCFVESSSVSTGSGRSLEIATPPSKSLWFINRESMATSGDGTGANRAEANRTNCRGMSACCQDAWVPELETPDPPQILAAAETTRIFLIEADTKDYSIGPLVMGSWWSTVP